MTRTLSPAQVRHLRLRAQRLHPEAGGPQDNVAQIVRDLGGIQAQELSSAALAIGVRSRRLIASQVEAARLSERSIVRTWGMRGTLHLLATEDLSWLLPLLGPVMIRHNQRRYAELGLEEDIRARAVRIIRDALGDRGPMTRGELMEPLARQGIPTAGQAGYHLLHHAGLLGVLCFGPDRAGEATFVLLEDWAPRIEPLKEEEALAELVHRYLSGHGPAQLEDLATWSGLPMHQVRAGLKSAAGQLQSVEIGDSQAWQLKAYEHWLDGPFAAQGLVRLLPGYDPYLLGYRRRDLMVAAQYAKRIHPGGGVIRPTLIVAGCAAGTWQSKRRAAGLEVTVEPFEGLDDEARHALEQAAREVGRFYDVEATLSVRPGESTQLP